MIMIQISQLISDDNLDECSNDEYNELPLDGKPYMCPKE